jgi:hypothetical protein
MAHSHLVASVDGMYFGDRHRGRAACNAGRHSLGTADGLEGVKLILDRRDGVHRGISFPMHRTPGKGGGIQHSMQQPWCSRGAGAVSMRQSLKLTTLYLVFSRLWRWHCRRSNTANSSADNATRGRL